MERFADFVVNNRIKMALASLLMAFIVFAGIPNLKLDTDGRVFMAADNPDKILLDNFEQEFAKDDNLAIVIVPEDGEVFTPRTLGAIGALTEDLWNLPYVRLVNSITRFQNTYATGDMMVVEDLVTEPSMVTVEEAAAARAVALDRIEIRNSLINEEGTATAISVIFRLFGIDLVSEIPKINAEFAPLLEEYRAAYPDITFKASGSVAVSQAFATASQKDGETLTPAMVVAMLVIVGVAASLGYWIFADPDPCGAVRSGFAWCAGMDPHSHQFGNSRGPIDGDDTCGGQQRPYVVINPSDDAGNIRPHHLGSARAERSRPWYNGCRFHNGDWFPFAEFLNLTALSPAWQHGRRWHDRRLGFHDVPSSWPDLLGAYPAEQKHGLS